MVPVSSSVPDKPLDAGPQFELVFELRPRRLSGLLFHAENREASLNVFLNETEVKLLLQNLEQSGGSAAGYRLNHVCPGGRRSEGRRPGRPCLGGSARKPLRRRVSRRHRYARAGVTLTLAEARSRRSCRSTCQCPGNMASSD